MNAIMTGNLDPLAADDHPNQADEALRQARADQARRDEARAGGAR
ncbi:hypothetical protein [Streptomyces sp. RKAG293]|nr:hypothetical protein [Streptomyces sp. RKAG293]